MGLDSVELVLAVEERYSIDIPDNIAEKLFTVGSLVSFVETELQRLGRDHPNSEALFEELRDLISKQLSIKPERIVREARFVQDLHIS